MTNAKVLSSSSNLRMILDITAGSMRVVNIVNQTILNLALLIVRFVLEAISIMT